MSKNTILSENIDISNQAQPSVTIPAQTFQELLENCQSLKDEVQDLRAIITNLEDKVSEIEATQDTLGENDLNQLRLINDLRKRDPGKTEISRAEKIEKYLQTRPDHRATFETLKGHLGVNKDRLLEAIKTLMNTRPGRYGIVRTPGDKRKRSLVMLPK